MTYFDEWKFFILMCSILSVYSWISTFGVLFKKIYNLEIMKIFYIIM